MNLVFIMIDSLRADYVGCYGNKWIKTPNVDNLAKESILFKSVFPESLPTIPIRRSTFTGKRVFPFEDYRPRKGDPVIWPGWEPIPEDRVTLAEILQNNGYRTALITDTFHMFKPSMNFHRGYDQWEWIRGQEADNYKSAIPKDVNLDKYMVPAMKGTWVETILKRYFANTKDRKTEEDYFAPRVFKSAMKWLEENKDAEKFFLCIDCFDPHEPWDPPKKYIDLYDPDYKGKEIIRPIYGNSDYLSEKELNHIRALYAGEVTMVDTWLGYFLDKMKELELMDTTLIVFLSDHGHPLGEHGIIGKLPWALYPELMDVPLLVRHPKGEKAGTHIDKFVYNHDIFPTILNLLEIPTPEKSNSINLWFYVTEKNAPERGYVTSIFRDYVWARDEKYAYISNIYGKEVHLYDVESDPNQHKDIAQENPKEVKRMFERILEDAKGVLPDHRKLWEKASDKFLESKN